MISDLSNITVIRSNIYTFSELSGSLLIMLGVPDVSFSIMSVLYRLYGQRELNTSLYLLSYDHLVNRYEICYNYKKQTAEVSP